MYAVLVVVVVEGMVFIVVLEACRWVVIVVVLGGWIGVCVGIGWVVVVGEGRWFVKEASYRRERKHPADGLIST